MLLKDFLLYFSIRRKSTRYALGHKLRDTRQPRRHTNWFYIRENFWLTPSLFFFFLFVFLNFSFTDFKNFAVYDADVRYEFLRTVWWMKFNFFEYLRRYAVQMYTLSCLKSRAARDTFRNSSKLPETLTLSIFLFLSLQLYSSVQSNS